MDEYQNIYPAFRHTIANMNPTEEEMPEPGNGLMSENDEVASLIDESAKAVDQIRRVLSNDHEEWAHKQKVFAERAEMYREAANLAQRAAEDIARWLNNQYLNDES
jgi:acyl-CoA reductase-like NAD-dependent aldehyde dehydrogenase